ncbi:50S ribosomal protein L32 [Aeromonas bivalvium]|uniref:50S ribosomal protein L32 n=1 Tax=Aeromonas bivalvium TaxID=440079 RepID=UPI0038CF68FB
MGRRRKRGRNRKRGAKKEGQKYWPYNWKQCEQCRAFTRSHHVGTNGAYPGTQVNNNHSHLTWQPLFSNLAKKLTTLGWPMPMPESSVDDQMPEVADNPSPWAGPTSLRLR